MNNLVKQTWLQLGPWLHLYRCDIGFYMERWILATPWGLLRLHHILESDSDRDFHDHPFDFTSLILSSGYTEHRPGQEPKRWRMGQVVRRKAEDLHRLELESGRPAWTVVLAGPIRRQWGFMTDFGWVHWRQYTSQKVA